MRTSDDLDKLADALCGAQGEMPNVPKDSTGQVGQQKTRYADLATVIEHVRPILALHGFSVVQGCHDGGHGVVSVTTRLLHESGQWIEETLSMPAGTTAQTVGSAITYARRYSLMAILGLAPDDDDGTAATAGAAQSERQRPLTANETMLKTLAMRFADHGIRDKADRLQFIMDVIGRPIESSKELTTTELTKVLVKLTAEQQGADSYSRNVAGMDA